MKPDPSEYTDENLISNVVLQENICPSTAFEVDQKKTASHYISEQGLTEYEYNIVVKVVDFIHQHSSILNDLPEEELLKFHRLLIDHIYYKVDFDSNLDIFYQNVTICLDEFFQAGKNSSKNHQYWPREKQKDLCAESDPVE